MRKVALVTGASRGLGLELARFLAGEGHSVIATARGERDLAAAAAGLAGLEGRVVPLAGDVADAAHRAALVDAARRLGGLDLLVNNASDLGQTPLPPLAEADLDRLRRTLEVNLIAPLALVQAALPLLRERRGLVVDVSSDAALGGYPGWGAYGASKAALDLATRTLAEENRASGVGFVSVDPGDMRTRMHQDAYPGQDIGDRPLPSATLPFWAWLLEREPLEVSGRRYQAQATLWEVAP